MNGTMLRFTGTNMFCADCHRELVSFNNDGTFNLAGLTSIESMAKAFVDEDGFHTPTEAIVTEATCYRRKCRLKRWLRQHNPRRH